MRLTIVRVVFAALLPVLGVSGLYSQNNRNPVTVYLIIDGSQAINSVIGDVSAWVSENLTDRILQNGDRLVIQSVQSPQTVNTVYSGTYGSGEKEKILRELAAVPAQGDDGTPDFTPALLSAAAAESDSFTYTLLICASPGGLSPTLEGSGSGLLKYSRIDEFGGWRAVVVGLNLDEKVGRAVTGWLSGLRLE
jgi:hypothetical protein